MVHNRRSACASATLMTEPTPSRRDFLTGRALREQVIAAGEAVADALETAGPPSRGPILLLRTTAMAADFDVMLNPDGPADQVAAASDALDEVHRLEQRLSSYREESDLMRLNRAAAERPVTVDAELYGLLRRAAAIHDQTEGAFDPVGGALIRLWQNCRRENRIPTADEVSAALAASGLRHVLWNDDERTVAFDRAGVEWHLGAIGKGFAVDRAVGLLRQRGVTSALVHGGKSSVFAWGRHAGHEGWPIGLQNPLLPDRRLVTLLLDDAALGTSGTAVQGFRHGGKRYGHILDLRCGWPAERMLSVSVVAPDAALADALSTAFFVLGVENALRCCDNFPEVGAILFPLPADGRTLEPVVHNIPPTRLFWTDSVRWRQGREAGRFA